MSNYTRILIAIDLSEESIDVVRRGSAMAAEKAAEMHLIHVIEPLSFAYGGDIPMDFSGIQEEISAQARQQLAQVGRNHNIDPAHQHTVFGRPEVEIHQMAKQLNSDLIVVGSHGRYGLALLMGSTANGVLHGASCDVLAVRVGI